MRTHSTLHQRGMTANPPQASYLRADDTLGDVLAHPAFGGFARLLLPWDRRTYDPRLPITNVGTLLPYHTHVDPTVIVASLNRLIDDVSTGRTEKRIAGLRRLGTDVLYRKYPGVGHGFGLGVGTTAAGWIADAVGFWAKQIAHAAHPDTAIAPVGGPR